MCKWILCKDSASLMTALEDVLLMAVVEAHEECDVMCVILPNTFIQAKMPDTKEHKHHVIMKITGVLVDMLVQLNLELYVTAVIFEGPH